MPEEDPESVTQATTSCLPKRGCDGNWAVRARRLAYCPGRHRPARFRAAAVVSRRQHPLQSLGGTAKLRIWM